jgi:hypothetical protein
MIGTSCVGGDSYETRDTVSTRFDAVPDQNGDY